MATVAKRVLVLEGDRDIREAIAGRLEGLGVEAVRAGDGLEGLRQLHAGPAPHAILLDLCMPRLDGQGFLARMREDPSFAEIPVISMTATTHAAMHGSSVEHQKPFDFDELAQILVSLCER